LAAATAVNRVAMHVHRLPAMPVHRLMKSASWLADQAQIPNPFTAKWFGLPNNAWVRVIELPVGGMF
jgi:hypothetical protein